ncbi:MAG TPA: hypothetical protein VF240_08600 [Pyrinomonadaceae bacterium]
MAVNVHEVFARGGKGLIDLLEFCVISVRMDPVFVFLAGEFRTHPTARGAVALYELFCTRDAPARVSALRALPPYNLRLPAAVRPLAESLERMRAARDAEAVVLAETEEEDGGEAGGVEPPGELPPPLFPARYIFDEVVRQLESGRGQLREVGELYDPTLTPYENLPGRRMTPAQKAFVDRVWAPRVRPRLVAAGFRRIADIA